METVPGTPLWSGPEVVHITSHAIGQNTVPRTQLGREGGWEMKLSRVPRDEDGMDEVVCQNLCYMPQITQDFWQ